MLDRAACERRVFRLATLLTGDPSKALRIISQVVDVQPDMRNLDGAHMDRLAVLRSREVKAIPLADECISTAVCGAIGLLNIQQREAWVLARVYGMEPREMARAMDCSVTATQRHLQQADDLVAGRLQSRAADAARRVLEFSMSLDVPAFHRVQQAHRKKAKRMMVALAMGLAMSIVFAIVLWWFGAIRFG